MAQSEVDHLEGRPTRRREDDMKMDHKLDRMTAGFSWLEVGDWWRVVMNNNAYERCRSQDISRRFTK